VFGDRGGGYPSEDCEPAQLKTEFSHRVVTSKKGGKKGGRGATGREEGEEETGKFHRGYDKI